jgi:hypothetical protein
MWVALRFRFCEMRRSPSSLRVNSAAPLLRDGEYEGRTSMGYGLVADIDCTFAGALAPGAREALPNQGSTECLTAVTPMTSPVQPLDNAD